MTTVIAENVSKEINGSSHKVIDLNIPKSEGKRIVIIGGGFAGLHLLKGLTKSKFQVVLLDKHNHHTFQPLLYQVATSGLDAGSISYPLREALKNHSDGHFRMTTVQHIVPQNNLVKTQNGNLKYDYLVIATGAKTNYFGMDSVAKNAFSMKSIAEAMEIRNQVLKNLEMAMLTTDPFERDKLTNIVIAGGGPTGVELAGALAEFKRYVIPQDYEDLNLDLVKIYLIELLPELLAPMSDIASKAAEKYLKDLGVEVITGTQIKNYDGDTVETDQGSYATRLLIWTGGVSGSFIPGIDEELINKKGRIEADAFGRVKGQKNIYVLGDVAQMETANFPEGHPQLAAVAVKQGKYLAKHFIRIEKAKKLIPFSYKEQGVMATIGRKKAVVDFANGWKIQGTIAWIIWLSVHLFSLVGFKNKVVTFINWTWNYFRRDRETRVITKE